MKLPVNKLSPLMMAIQHVRDAAYVCMAVFALDLEHSFAEGPVVVSVDGEPWGNYASGVFDGCKRPGLRITCASRSPIMLPVSFIVSWCMGLQRNGATLQSRKLTDQFASIVKVFGQ